MKPIHFACVSAVAAVLALGLGAGSASARTIQVGTCTTAALHFSTIQAAVNAAFANDTVAICPGTYPEQVIATRNVTLTNVTGQVAPTIASPSGGVVANTTSLTSGNPIAAQILATGTDVAPLTKVNVKNLIVDGSNNQIGGCSPNLIGIYYRDAYGQIATNTVQNQRLSDSLLGCQVGLGIFVQNTSALPTSTALVTISKNSVTGFQKNGITTNESGSAVKITNNTVTGIGPTPAIAQNGIQVAYGATGSVASNTVSNMVYTGPSAASTGVLGYASSGLTIKSNKIASTQYGVSVDSDPSLGNADGNMIVSNTIQNTDTYDGLDVCSDGNSVTKNTINSSEESGIHLDALCTGTDNAATGINNAVSSNKINGACAGILSGQASGTNNIGTNKIVNTTYPTLFDSDVCPAESASATLAGAKTDKTTSAGGARLARAAHRVAKPIRL